MSWTVFDLETTVKAGFKRKANPFLPENFIVAIGWQRQGGEVQGSYSKTGKHSPQWFEALLAGTKLLIGQNIKFDILYAITRSEKAYKAWMAWVAAGGLVWDCQLAEYLLRGQEQSAHMLSMDEMVEAYGGNVKLDEVKALWEAGVDTPDIPEDLLMRYLCGYEGEDGERVHGDIGNTLAIYQGQIAKARKRGQLKSILLNMGSLLASIEMEKNGMAIDKELGLKQAAALEVECAELRTKLKKYLPDDLPFEFNWGSGHQLSAFIFGGSCPYDERVEVLDDDGKLTYYQTDAVAYFPADAAEGEYLVCPGDITEEQIPDFLEKGMLQVYGSGKKKGLPKTKNVKVPDIARGPKMRWETLQYEFPRMTEPEKKWETKNEGIYQTNADVIEELGFRDIPFLKDLTSLNKKDKDLTTYYITFDEKKGLHKGMLTLVMDDGIIHGSINHTSTVTGRFSASNPNLQNIPRADTSEVKKLFISRFGAEGSIIQSDFSSLEIYIQALLTGDRQLLADLKTGLDMHCSRVASKYHITYEEAVQRCKKLVDASDYKLWKSRRTACKEFSFQRAFGAGAKAISDATGMTVDEVETLIINEMARYPDIEPFYEKVTAKIKASRVPTSLWVPHDTIRGLNVQIGKGWYNTPDGKKYTYREYPAPEGFIKRGGDHASFSPPEIKNYVVQGTGGEWAKAAMWLAVRAFYAQENFGGKALLINMVHDAQYVDAHESVRKEAAALLHAAMEGANDLMEQRFDWHIEAPVPSETNYGQAMYYETEMSVTYPDFKEVTRNYRLWIRKTFLNGYTPSFETEEAA